MEHSATHHSVLVTVFPLGVRSFQKDVSLLTLGRHHSCFQQQQQQQQRNIPYFCRHVEHQWYNRWVIVAIDDEAHVPEFLTEVCGVLWKLSKAIGTWRKTKRQGRTLEHSRRSVSGRLRVEPRQTFQTYSMKLMWWTWPQGLWATSQGYYYLTEC